MFAIKHATNTINMPEELTITTSLVDSIYIFQLALSDMTSLMLKHGDENGFKETDLLGIQFAIEKLEKQLEAFKTSPQTSDLVETLDECESKLNDLKSIFKYIEIDVYAAM